MPKGKACAYIVGRVQEGQRWWNAQRHDQWRRQRTVLLGFLRWLGTGIVILWAISCGPHTSTLAQSSARLSPQILVDVLLHATEAQIALIAILLTIGLSWSFRRQRVLAEGLFAVRQSPPSVVSELVHDILPHRRLYLLVDDRPYAACIGFWRPAIYVTQGLVANASPVALRAALAHEEAHRRRHDPLRLFLLRSLTRVLSLVPGVAAFSDHIELRAEVSADRFACNVTSRAALAQAILLTIRGGPSPASPLSAPVTNSLALHGSAGGQAAHQPCDPAHLSGYHQAVYAERLTYLMASDERPLPSLLRKSSAPGERQRRESARTSPSQARLWIPCGVALVTSFVVFVGLLAPMTPLLSFLTACAVKL